ncbi:MAG: hypothetical protein G01um101456_421 [Parcubacteria group bacterium Gr01-1014_56]|nr:MAG: hypothetical protein G01um101456_421 [Parcubacteria group bacterium Gr01-1014_56]
MLPHESAEKFAKWLKAWGVEPVLLGPLFLLLLFIIFIWYDSDSIGALFTATLALSPLWVPLFLLRYFWITWMNYIRYQFWLTLDYVLLEVVLPPEVEKSPLAMEVALTTLWNSAGETTFIDRLWKGKCRAVWSLEIASNEGRVSYYIRMRRDWRNIMEARMYGQFPEARITEVEDYTEKVPFKLGEYELFGLEYIKVEAGAVPIKTYYDYELNKDPDVPETTVDPITHILELLSSIGKDEYIWLQYIVRTRKKDEWYGFYKKKDQFKEGGKEEIEKIMRGAGERAKRLAGDDPQAQAQAASRGSSILTETERRRVEAIEKSMGKLIFEVGIRSLYFAKKERFKPIYVTPLVRMFDTYRTADLNQMNHTRGLTIFDYPWQDYHGIRKARIQKELFSHYHDRAYFYAPHDQTPIFLNLEELASLWHFPSSTVNPPGLERVAAKRAEAPTGLPTGL